MGVQNRHFWGPQNDRFWSDNAILFDSFWVSQRAHFGIPLIDQNVPADHGFAKSEYFEQFENSQKKFPAGCVFLTILGAQILQKRRNFDVFGHSQSN